MSAWILRNHGQLYLRAMSLGDTQRGIEKLRRKKPAEALPLDGWLAQVEADYVGRILGIRAAEAKYWAVLQAPTARRVVDALIAATAIVRGLTVATRNVADFQAMGAETVNPWES